MKKILILCFTELHRDPRVYRHIIALKDKFSVSCAGFTDPEIDGVNFIELDCVLESKFKRIINAIWLKVGCFNKLYWSKALTKSAYNKLKNYNFDLILANDIDTLPLAFRLSKEKQSKLVFDSHEYTPREFENSWKWRFFYQKYKTFLCNSYLSLTDEMITVCEGIAEEYTNKFTIKKPMVLTNATLYQDLQPNPIGSKVRIIHHGISNRERKIELMIEMSKCLDQRFELYLMLMPDTDGYYNESVEYAANAPNVKFIEPVKMQQISDFINSYDIGLYILESNSINTSFALPNKLFEFIQARLMVAIGPSIEMAKIVRQYNLGVVTDTFDPQNMADTLNALSNDAIWKLKQNSDKSAKILSLETNQQKLSNLINNVLER